MITCRKAQKSLSFLRENERERVKEKERERERDQNKKGPREKRGETRRKKWIKN